MISRWEQGRTEIPAVSGAGATGAGRTSTMLRHPALSSAPAAVTTRLPPPGADLASRMIRNPVPDQEFRGPDDTTGQAIVPVSPVSGPPGDVAGVTVDSMTRLRVTTELRRRRSYAGPLPSGAWIGAGAGGPQAG